MACSGRAAASRNAFGPVLEQHTNSEAAPNVACTVPPSSACRHEDVRSHECSSLDADGPTPSRWDSSRRCTAGTDRLQAMLAIDCWVDRQALIVVPHLQRRTGVCIAARRKAGAHLAHSTCFILGVGVHKRRVNSPAPAMPPIAALYLPTGRRTDSLCGVWGRAFGRCTSTCGRCSGQRASRSLATAWDLWSR